MREFTEQLRWQFVLLQKNNIISISLAVTVFYGLILFFLKDLPYMDKFLTAIVLNDPATIGFFFIGLTISTEAKHQLHQALFVTPGSHHIYLISRVLSISIVGWVCALALAVSVLGFSFDVVGFTIGTLGICFLAALLGVIVVSHTFEFLKFVMYSIPIFLFFVNLPLLEYLGVTNIGMLKYLLPVQGGINLIVHAYTPSPVLAELVGGYVSLVLWVAVMYALAWRQFQSKIING